jgi:phospholipid transport system substrate-binding protein
MSRQNRHNEWVTCTLVIILFAAQPVNACDNDPNEPNDPNELLRLKWDAVSIVLQNKDIDQKAKQKQISDIVTPIFDYPLMAKLALGRKNWPKLSPPQREKFIQLFVERLKTSYGEKIALYTDEKAVFEPAVRQEKNIHIPMNLISKDKIVSTIYKLHRTGDCWKIYDVEIEGVSILLTYRSQFDDILSRGTVEELLARLSEQPAR